VFAGSAGADAFNIDRLDAESATAAQIVDASNQLPVMAPRRLVLVRGAERLLRAESDAGEEGPLARYLKQPSPTTCLVLFGEKPDLRLRLSKEIAAAGAIGELAAPKDHALVAWLQEEAARLGKKLPAQAATLLIAFTGNELTAAAQELSKLAAFTGDRPEIRAGDVEEAVKDRQGFEVWPFLDALKARDGGQALGALDRYLGRFRRLDEALFPLIGTLRREVLILMFAQEARERRGLRGAPLGEAIANHFGVHPYRARKAAEAAAHFKGEELAGALDRLLDLDRRLKTSATPPRLLLDAWVWETCGPRAARA
jgi:DNA polymerase-3 subunit delta